MSREAIILAGGFGTRLRSVVSDVPKPMAPVAGRPFLGYLLDRLRRQGYSHVVLSTGYLHEKVEAHFGHHYGGMTLDYAREATPLGTGGAIVNALACCHEEELTVLNGDTLFDLDLDALHRFFARHDTRLALALRWVADAGRYGAVELDAPTGRIAAFREKCSDAGAGLINGGIYQLRRSLLDGHGVGEPFSFERDLMQLRHAEEPFFGFVSEAYFIDIGVPDDYARAQTELPAL